MTSWELAAVLGSLFFLGLIRGTVVCVSICVPGLLPYLAEKPRGAMDGAKFGLILCIPRLLIFAGIGLVWGALSFVLFGQAFEDNALLISIYGYMVLGLIIAALGMGMFLKGAREKDDLRKERLRLAEEGDPEDIRMGQIEPNNHHEDLDLPECVTPERRHRHRAANALSSIMLRVVPESNRSERTFLLIWGSILGFTCLIEVSVLELGAMGVLAAQFGNATVGAALLGALAMVVFAVGATVPVVVASSAFAAYVDRVTAQEKLLSLRITGSIVMILIGTILFIRSISEAIAVGG
jgi:hypothetical protein